MKLTGLIVSVDFELDWGYNNPSEPLNKDEVLEGLNNLIALFKKHKIKTTWATVGKLFENIKSEDDTKNQLNWIKENLINNEYIEIGSHTYSHIFCEEVSKEVFLKDIIEVNRISEVNELEFKSIVFPRNQYRNDNLEVLKANGYTHFRNVLEKWYLKTNKYSTESLIKRFVLRGVELLPLKRDVIIKKESNLVSISDSRFLRFFPSSFLGRLISPIYYMVLKYEMKKSFERGCLYHIWFHPHNFIKNPKAVYRLDEILTYYNSQKRVRKNLESYKFSDIN